MWKPMGVISLVVLSTSLAQGFVYGPWSRFHIGHLNPRGPPKWNALVEESLHHYDADISWSSVLSSTSAHSIVSPPGNDMVTSPDWLSSAHSIESPPGNDLVTSPHWLKSGSALTGVLASIVWASLHPRHWKTYWEKSHKLIFASLCVASVSMTGHILPWILALKIVAGSIVLCCYLLPAVYVSVASFAWASLCHGGNVRRVLRDVYLMAPWWLSNKLLNDDDDAESEISQYVQVLNAEPSTVAIAYEFARTRKAGLDITNPTNLAHHTGVLVLYIHAFGPSVQTGPDWPHVVMHCCYGRIMDDYQDMDEDSRDGNFHRNFVLRILRQPSTDLKDPIENCEVIARTVAVQAMRGMRWHEDQIVDPLVRQYARGVTKALEVLIMFRNQQFKQKWNEIRAEALDTSPRSSRQPLFDWPFQSLIPEETVAASH